MMPTYATCVTTHHAPHHDQAPSPRRTTRSRSHLPLRASSSDDGSLSFGRFGAHAPAVSYLEQREAGAWPSPQERVLGQRPTKLPPSEPTSIHSPLPPGVLLPRLQRALAGTGAMSEVCTPCTPCTPP
eukprot:364467-Chlamydomonas_euryale.AAC.4